MLHAFPAWRECSRRTPVLHGSCQQELRTQLETRSGEIKQKQLQVTATEEQVAKLEQMLRESKFATEKVQKEYNLLNEKMQKLHHDLEEQIHTNTQVGAGRAGRSRGYGAAGYREGAGLRGRMRTLAYGGAASTLGPTQASALPGALKACLQVAVHLLPRALPGHCPATHNSDACTCLLSVPQPYPAPLPVLPAHPAAC